MSFPIGQLTQYVTRATREALEAGTLLSLETQSEVIEDQRVPFLVRILSSRLRKEEAAVFQDRAGGRPVNPFLPYDRSLFVADLSETHVCLLNKYNVVADHLLMVTRDFEPQENALSQQDFYSAALCLREFDGLAFYNAGVIAGASQPHKHLQFVRLDLDPAFARPPIEAILPEKVTGSPATSTELPFAHGFHRFEYIDWKNPSDTAEELLEAYLRLLSLFRGPRGSYNLLLTREWMLVVPRRRESFESISVNSLGYAGSLLVKNEHELNCIRRTGPMQVLRYCGQPPVT